MNSVLRLRRNGLGSAAAQANQRRCLHVSVRQNHTADIPYFMRDGAGLLPGLPNRLTAEPTIQARGPS